MNRGLVILGGGAILLVAAGVAFVATSGGGGSEAPVAEAPPVTVAGSAPAAPEARPAPAAQVDAEALARFEAWAEPLRAAGLTVTEETAATDGTAIVLTGLAIAGPPDALAWQLLMPAARIEPGANAGTTLRPTGPAVLDLTVGDVTTRQTIEASALRIDVERNSDNRATSLVLLARDVVIAGDDLPITIESAELRFALAEAGAELVPARSTATLAVSDLVLPGLANGPLGSRISSLAADLTLDQGFQGWGIAGALDAWRLAGTVISISNLQLEWGALDLAGTGLLTVDGQGRPAGRLEVAVADPLMVLDAFHVVRRFDRDLLADVYAALLEEIGRDPTAPRLAFTVDIADGNLVVLGADRSIPDVALGTVTPLFGLSGP